MLMEVKHHIRVIFLSVKYNIMREMTNRLTFILNILFMILNNATFIIQWLLLFSLKPTIGGYNMNGVMILWSLAASSYGLSHLLFQGAYGLPELIIYGKLDSYLVMPKNVLLCVITSRTRISAIGDLIYGYLILCITQFSLINILLFTIFTITGALIITAYGVIMGSISFWIVKGDIISDNLNNIMINMSTYPDGIFKGFVRFLLYSIVPVGLSSYLPVKILIEFRLGSFFIILLFMVFIMSLSFLIFYQGLKKYSSSNLMSARI